MLWLGLLILAVGGGLLYGARGAASRVLHMKATETSRLGELFKLIEEIRGELGGGPSEWREVVELKGRVRCDQPVLAEMSGAAAVAVRGQVVREVEELREERDSQGNTSSRWVSRRETIHRTSLDAPFLLDDGSGQIRVQPSGASLTLHKVVDRYEPSAQLHGGAALTLGRFSFHAPAFSASGTLRVKGYHFTEEILAVGADIYALGEVSDTDDGVAMHACSDKSKPFLLSSKSEEELVSAGASQAKWMKVAGVAALGLGASLALWGIVTLVLG